MAEQLLTRRTSMTREKVINLVESWIKSGKLHVGDSLPSEQKISDHLGVARGTVRSGLDMLEERNVIIKRNQRRIVAEKQETQSLSMLLNSSIVLAGLSTDDLKKFNHSTLLAGIEAAVTLQLESLPFNIFSIKMKSDDRTKYLQSLIESGPEGIIFFQPITLEHDFTKLYELCLRKQIPCVINSGNDKFSKMNRVSFEHEEANYQLTKKLIERGCRNIANLSYKPIPKEHWIEERYKGYLKAVNEAGLQIPSLVQRERFDIDYDKKDRAAFEQYSRLFAGYLVDVFHGSSGGQVDAIMVNSDWDVPLVNAACELHGKVPGKDIIIAGYDNKFESGPFCPYNDRKPTLTVDKQHDLTGEKIVELLVGQLDKKLLQKSPVHLKINAKIIQEN